MAVYLLKPKCGNYIGPPDSKGKRTTYKAGSRIVSDEDLVAKWPNKFSLVSVSDEAPLPTAPDIPVLDKKKEKQSKQKQKDMEEPLVETSATSEYGVDVTKDFPTAAEVNLQVFEKSKWFTVVDPDNGEVLNEKKLRRNKVENFLADYLPEDTDEEEDYDEGEDYDEDEEEDEEESEDDEEE